MGNGEDERTSEGETDSWPPVIAGVKMGILEKN